MINEDVNELSPEALDGVSGGDAAIRGPFFSWPSSGPVTECDHRGCAFEKLGELVALGQTIFYQERKCSKCGKVYHVRCDGSASNWVEITEEEYYYRIGR